MIAWLMGTRLGRALAGVVALVLGGLGLWAAGRREGRKGAISEIKDEDYENAEDIRRRVERDLDKRVRDYDSTGWRDE